MGSIVKEGEELGGSVAWRVLQKPRSWIEDVKDTGTAVSRNRDILLGILDLSLRAMHGCCARSRRSGKHQRLESHG